MGETSTVGGLGVTAQTLGQRNQVCRSSDESGELQRTECRNENAEGKKTAAELSWEVTERDEEGRGLLDEMLVQGQV